MNQSSKQEPKGTLNGHVKASPPVGKEAEFSTLEDKTVFSTGGAKRPDEMQVVWSKTEVIRVISGKNKCIPPDTLYSFRVIEGQDKGKISPLRGKSQFSIGRGGADISIKDTRVSKIHCMIEIYDGVVVIKDMESTNGSLLNQYVLAEDFLKQGDKVQIGHTVLEFQVKN
ncbi:MAG: FHA domain-containing protein [Nitrospiria bacterium]